MFFLLDSRRSLPSNGVVGGGNDGLMDYLDLLGIDVDLLTQTLR
jgi:hypothetical protein